MQLEALSRVLAGGRWFSFNAGLEAVRAMPELMDGLPFMVGDPPGIVVHCRDIIRPMLRSPGIEADPLVGCVYRLVEQGRVLSPGAAVLPILETWRQMRAKVLALPLQGRAMEAAFQSARLGAVVATLREIPAFGKVVAAEQAALIHPDHSLEGDGDPTVQRRSLIVARMAALLRPPDETTAELLRWPRAETVQAGVLAIGLGDLRAAGFSRETDAAWEALKREVPDALTVDMGAVGLLVSVKLTPMLKLQVQKTLGTSVLMGFGYGVIQGGSDGETSRLSGAAIDSAFRAMGQGRRNEICLDEETALRIGAIFEKEGAKLVAGEGRCWEKDGIRYQMDIAGVGSYTIRSLVKDTYKASEVSSIGMDYDSLLLDAFGSSSAPVAAPVAAPAKPAAYAPTISAPQVVPEVTMAAPQVVPEVTIAAPQLTPETSDWDLGSDADLWGLAPVKEEEATDNEPTYDLEVEDEDEKDLIEDSETESSDFGVLIHEEEQLTPNFPLLNDVEPADPSRFRWKMEAESEAPVTAYLPGAPSEIETSETNDHWGDDSGFGVLLGDEDSLPPPPAILPEPPVLATRAETAPETSRKRPPPPDFGYLLAGYCWFSEGKEVVFGRTYGRRLVDYHRFDCQDPAEAYRRFMQSKIQEGFTPQPDMVGDLPAGVNAAPLDRRLLHQAWEALA